MATDIEIEVLGQDLATLHRVCKELEATVGPMKGVRDVATAPVEANSRLEIQIDRQKAARLGLSIAAIQETIDFALNGRIVTEIIDGRERTPVRVRLAGIERQDAKTLRRLRVNPPNNPARETNQKPSPDIALNEVAQLQTVKGPAVIWSENGRLTNRVTFSVTGRDISGFLDEALPKVAEKVRLPDGGQIKWRGAAEDELKIRGALSKLSAEDRSLVEAQRFCPILEDNRLGSMGPPVKVIIKGEPISLCCSGCKEEALAKPDATLAKVARLRARAKAAPPHK